MEFKNLILTLVLLSYIQVSVCLINLSKVTIRNKLGYDISDVHVKYCESTKYQDGSGFFYVFDWRTVDMETGYNCRQTNKLNIGDVNSNEIRSNDQGLDCSTTYRGYWQVYWTRKKSGYRYKINKNNAQMNVWNIDDKGELEITLLYEQNTIRLNFVLPSGNAYFYAKGI